MEKREILLLLVITHLFAFWAGRHVIGPYSNQTVEVESPIQGEIVIPVTMMLKYKRSLEQADVWIADLKKFKEQELSCDERTADFINDVTELVVPNTTEVDQRLSEISSEVLDATLEELDQLANELDELLKIRRQFDRHHELSLQILDLLEKHFPDDNTLST